MNFGYFISGSESSTLKMKGETEALRLAMNEIKTEFCGIDPAGVDEEEKEDIIQVCFPLFKILSGSLLI